MARRAVEMSLLLVFATMMVFPRSSAQTLGGCTPVLSSLSPCISYITGNSSAPTVTCCSQLAGLVQTQAQCLCTILGGAAGPLGFIVNQTQALTLPGACKIRMSSASPCGGFTVSSPAGAPAAAPTPAAPPVTVTAPTPAPSRTVPVESTPSVPSPSAPSGGGSTKTPTGPSTASSSTKFTPALFLFSLLFAASSYALI